MNFVSGQWPWAPCHRLWYNLERARRWGACWKIFNVAKGKESYWNGKICQSTEESINPGSESDDKVVRPFTNTLLFFSFPTWSLLSSLLNFLWYISAETQIVVRQIDLRRKESSTLWLISKYIPSAKIYCHVLCAYSDRCCRCGHVKTLSSLPKELARYLNSHNLHLIFYTRC